MSERRNLHPDLTAEERRRLLLEGLERFNRGEFFASHESWEEVWRSTSPEPRDLFQGLVQIAAGMHHFLDRGNAEPARRLLGKGRDRLEPFPAVTLGLDLAGLVATVRVWEAWLAAPAGEAPAPPRLVLVDPSSAG